MQTTTLLNLLCATLLLALLGLAAISRRGAEQARASGYDQGYDAAKLAAHDRVTALNHDIARLQELAIANRAEHSQALEATMLDCDDRIAIYAARALTAEDVITLRIVNKQLLLAAQTYLNLQLADQARFANTAAQRFGLLIERIAAALPDEREHVEGILNMAPKQEAVA